MIRCSRTALILWTLLNLTALQTYAQGTCNPPLTGQPCGYGGIATQGALEPSLNLGAGNPINLATGNKHQHDIDLPATSAAPLLELSRHYNAMDRRRSAFGYGWVSSYDTRLHPIGSTLQIVQADGSRIIFRRDPADTRNTTPTANGVLIHEDTGWLWRWPNGQELRFDPQGRLAGIHSAQTGAVTIQRHETGKLQGQIDRIHTNNAPPLHFSYQIINSQPYVRHIDTHAGRFQYYYESIPAPASPAQPAPTTANSKRNLSLPSNALRLTAVTRPDGMQRRYLYEETHQSGNPYHLTGIELHTADKTQTVRTGSWSYNAEGKVSAFHIGPRRPETHYQVHYIRAAAPEQRGVTEIHNAQGLVTRVEIGLQAGRHAVLKVQGQPCPGCAPPGSQASYDTTTGRLATMNGHRLQRHPNGALKRLTPAPGHGWPGLSLHYNPQGLRTGWETSLTGLETTRYTPHGRLAQRRFANNDEWHYEYDAVGRPIRLIAANRKSSQTTRLHWKNTLLTGIAHPYESEVRTYDALERLERRTIERPAAPGWPAIRYTEKFEYDGQHRLVRHHLPEGGVLHYRWGSGHRLLAIHWENAQGNRQPVINSIPNLPGYRYGNGLWLRTVSTQGRTNLLAVHDGTTPLWEHWQAPDAQHRVEQETHHLPKAGHRETWRYAYDPHSRLSVEEQLVSHAEPEPSSTRSVWRHDLTAPHRPTASSSMRRAWRHDGSLVATRIADRTHRPAVQRDASGLPIAVSGRSLHYGPNRRLTAVSQTDANGATVINDHYRHNAFGHRIAVQTTEDHYQFFYLGNRLVAESRVALNPAPDVKTQASLDAEPARAKYPPTTQKTPRLVTRRYIHAHHVPVGLIDYTDEHPQGILYAVHADLIGAPRLVTDAGRSIRWLGSYSPTGQAVRVAGDLTLNLRLPGQFHDDSTGWHDNLLRTYLPQWGHYLEPDPLGPLPGSQALGYAGQQPRQYIDPNGLLLFAFDGTRNSAETQSNVWKLSQRYLDGPVFYHPGPGNPYHLDWDAVTAHTAPDILDTQWQSLLDALAAAPSAALDDTVPIDIIGFSRGAALARHFGNQVNLHTTNGRFSFNDPMRGLVTACVDLRFMGLFDTVAQFGLAGAQNTHYDLTIAGAWGWVAHAVALHERRWLFPLSSVADSAVPNIVEAPFIGAHTDIGGGVAYSEVQHNNTRGDLSDVTLNWMIWQARAASLQFGTSNPEQAEVSQPILHDDRSSLARTIQNGDRRIDDADGSKQHDYQDDHERLGRRQRDITETLIARYDNWRQTSSRAVGHVNLDGYAQWLHDELGWQAAPP